MVMRIKRYEGEEKELPRIIRQIKRDLGENAVVKTRRYKKGGLLGLGAKPMVEVYAGVERDLSGDSGRKPETPPLSKSEVLERLLPKAGNGINGYPNSQQNGASRTEQPVIYQPPGASPVVSPSRTPTATESSSRIETEIQRLAHEIADIKRSLDQGVGTKQEVEEEERRFPRWLNHIREKLIANEVGEDVAEQMIEETLQSSGADTLTDFEGALSAFQRTVTTTIQARGSLKGNQVPRVLALAGPTGVGKTTTLAKLAATANLLDKERVGLVSADTYRIAAIDQLRTFSGILDIPLKVVFSPAELREALDEYSDMDRILIDTAGRSPNNDERMEELRELIAAHEDVQCHLVVSATTRPKDFQMICERFRPAGYSRFVVTKIDETATLGPVLSLLYSEGLPASYLTNGQSVPDDIVLGEESDLLSLIIRRSMT